MGSVSLPVNMNGALTDDQLDDFLQAWIVALTGLDPTLVRPWWQPDPPPIPDWDTPCWISFGIRRCPFDWDPVVQQWAPDQGPATGAPSSTVFRNQRLEITLVFYGGQAGDYALTFRMGTGIHGNLEMLLPMKLVEVEQQVTTSEFIKSRWQRRVDIGVVLRRPVQFTYSQPVIAGAYGTIVSDAPTVDWEVDPPS